MTVPPQHPSAGPPDDAAGPPSPGPPEDATPPTGPPSADPPAAPGNAVPAAPPPNAPEDVVPPASPAPSDSAVPPATAAAVPPPEAAFPFGQPPSAASATLPEHFAPPGPPPPGAAPATGFGPAMPPLSETQQFPAMSPYPPGPGGPPGPAYPGPPPATRRSRWVLILAITTALFFVLSATMTGLYVSKSAELDAANSDIRDLRKSLDDSQQALKKNKAELKDSRTANRALSECVDEVSKVFDALDRTGEASASLVGNAKSACDRAERYLD